MTVTINGTTGIDKVQPNATLGQVISANGVAFPAIQSQSSDANTLDDYEEGYFTAYFAGNASGTPLFTGGALGYPYALRYTGYNARYVKIGKQVSVQGQILMDTAFSYNSGFGSGTTVYIGGLPFVEEGATGMTALGGTYPAGSIGYLVGTGWSAGYAPMTIVEAGYSTMRVEYQNTNATAIANAALFFVASSQICFSVTYTTSA